MVQRAPACVNQREGTGHVPLQVGPFHTSPWALRTEAEAGSSASSCEPPGPTGPGGSCLVAGARDEVQQRKSGREPEVVRVMFRNRGSALVPLGAVPATDS